MKYPFKLFLYLLTTTLLLASCSNKSNKLAKYIPKTTTVLVAFDVEAMGGKIKQSGLTLDSVKKALSEPHFGNDATGIITKWEDLKQSGIKLDEDVFMFVSNKGSVMTSSRMDMGLLAEIKDATEFEAFIKKQKQNVQVQKGKEYSYVALDNESTIGWNKEVAIFLSTKSNPSFGSNPFDTSRTQQQSISPTEELAKLFALNKADAVVDVKPFNEVMKKEGDIKLFYNSSSAALDAIPMMGMTKASDLLKDAYTTGVFNFENGAIKGEFDSYVSKDLQNLLSKNKGRQIDVNLVERYPSSNINGFAAFSFDPQIIYEVIQYIGLDKTADSFLSSMLGVTIADILHAFKGDFAFFVSDFGMKEVKYEKYAYTKPDFKMLYASTVGDKAAFTKLVTALEQKGIIVKNGNGYRLKGSGMNSAGDVLLMDSEWVVYSNDSSLSTQYRAGTTKSNIKSEVKDAIKDKPSFVYVDFQSFMNAIKDSAASFVYAKQTFKDLIFSGENLKDNKTHSGFTLKLMNAQENSLASICKLALRVMEDNKREAQKFSVEDPMHPSDPTPPKDF